MKISTKQDFNDFLTEIGAEILETKETYEYAHFSFREINCIVWSNEKGVKLFNNKTCQKVWSSFERGDKRVRFHPGNSRPYSEISLSRKSRIFERDGDRCFYSGKIMTCKEATIEHLIPKSRDGRNSIENLVCCTLEENLKMGSKSLVEKLKHREHRVISDVFSQLLDV